MCTNIHLALILPFALAGLMLVLFLIVCNFTVSMGTINGLIFYANIVHVIFDAPKTSALKLTVVIANLNFESDINSFTAVLEVYCTLLYNHDNSILFLIHKSCEVDYTNSCFTTSIWMCSTSFGYTRLSYKLICITGSVTIVDYFCTADRSLSSNWTLPRTSSS